VAVASSPLSFLYVQPLPGHASVAEGGERKYQDRFAVIMLPVPLDVACNPLILITSPANQDACEYAKLGLAVYHAKHEAYREFDDWLFATPEIPPLAEARSHAASLVGQEALAPVYELA
jgi:hypothetical protein